MTKIPVDFNFEMKIADLSQDIRFTEKYKI